MKAQSIVLFGSLFVLAACGGPTYKATLTGGGEVPTVASPGMLENIRLTWTSKGYAIIWL